MAQWTTPLPSNKAAQGGSKGCPSASGALLVLDHYQGLVHLMATLPAQGKLPNVHDGNQLPSDPGVCLTNPAYTLYFTKRLINFMNWMLPGKQSIPMVKYGVNPGFIEQKPGPEAEIRSPSIFYK